MNPFRWTLLVAGVVGVLGVAGAGVLQALGKTNSSWLIAFVWGTSLLSLAVIAFLEAQRKEREAGHKGLTEGLKDAVRGSLLDEISTLRATINGQRAELSRLHAEIEDLKGSAKSALHIST